MIISQHRQQLGESSEMVFQPEYSSELDPFSLITVTLKVAVAHCGVEANYHATDLSNGSSFFDVPICSLPYFN